MLQGERETNELNNKLAQFSENAMKFTMDGGLSAYDYKAEEEEAGEDVNFKALAGEHPSSFSHHLQLMQISHVCGGLLLQRCRQAINQLIKLYILSLCIITFPDVCIRDLHV